MKAFIQGGCNESDKDAGQGQMRYNNNFGWVSDLLVSRRKSNKKGVGGKAIDLLHELPVEYRIYWKSQESGILKRHVRKTMIHFRDNPLQSSNR